LNLNKKIKTATKNDIYEHLVSCNDNFIPPLNKTINILEYSEKLHSKSTTFEIWDNELLAGLIACYFNQKTGFITNVSTLLNYNGKGIASSLLSNCIDYSRKNGVTVIKLEVNRLNTLAIRIYNKFGFTIFDEQDESFIMKLEL
tara:strand:- start:298 stop:729 length:432 start_codon:yes stop_codon:yes gene_type:complete